MDHSSLRIGITTHPDPDLTSPYFSDCMAGLLTVFRPPSLIVNPHDVTVDGWILLAPDLAQVDVVRKNGLPAVIVNGKAEGIPSIDLDNVGAAREMTAHLVDQGHRRIGFIAGKSETPNGRDRQEGYRRGMEERGIPWDASLIIEGRFDRVGGRNAMVQFLEMAAPPTAVFAANDHMALGARDVLNEKKIPVPTRMALSGFDDIPDAATAGLTTVRQPLSEMTAHAANSLFERLVTGRWAEKQITWFPGKLIVRASSAARVK